MIQKPSANSSMKSLILELKLLLKILKFQKMQRSLLPITNFSMSSARAKGPLRLEQPDEELVRLTKTRPQEKLLKSKIFSILKDSQKNFVKMLKRKSFCLKPNTKLNIQVLKLKQRDYLNWVKESPLLFAILSAISTKL